MSRNFKILIKSGYILENGEFDKNRRRYRLNDYVNNINTESNVIPITVSFPVGEKETKATIEQKVNGHNGHNGHKKNGYDQNNNGHDLQIHDSTRPTVSLAKPIQLLQLQVHQEPSPAEPAVIPVAAEPTESTEPTEPVIIPRAELPPNAVEPPFSLSPSSEPSDLSLPLDLPLTVAGDPAKSRRGRASTGKNAKSEGGTKPVADAYALMRALPLPDYFPQALWDRWLDYQQTGPIMSNRRYKTVGQAEACLDGVKQCQAAGKYSALDFTAWVNKAIMNGWKSFLFEDHLSGKLPAIQISERNGNGNGNGVIIVRGKHGEVRSAHLDDSNRVLVPRRTPEESEKHSARLLESVKKSLEQPGQDRLLRDMIASIERQAVNPNSPPSA